MAPTPPQFATLTPPMNIKSVLETRLTNHALLAGTARARPHASFVIRAVSAGQGLFLPIPVARSLSVRLVRGHL